MKKLISFTLGAVLVLLLASVAYAQDDPTVYVTKSGSKYHNAGCSYLKKSAIPMTRNFSISDLTFVKF